MAVIRADGELLLPARVIVFQQYGYANACVYMFHEPGLLCAFKGHVFVFKTVDVMQQFKGVLLQFSVEMMIPFWGPGRWRR